MPNLVGLLKELTTERTESTEKNPLKISVRSVISVVSFFLAHPFSHSLQKALGQDNIKLDTVIIHGTLCDPVAFLLFGVKVTDAAYGRTIDRCHSDAR